MVLRSPLYTEEFGWKVRNLGKNCSGIYFVIQRDLILKTVDVDLSFALWSPPAAPGMAVCLLRWRGFPGRPSCLPSRGQLILRFAVEFDFRRCQNLQSKRSDDWQSCRPVPRYISKLDLEGLGSDRGKSFRILPARASSTFFFAQGRRLSRVQYGARRASCGRRDADHIGI
jgi:hypothetical protein